MGARMGTGPLPGSIGGGCAATYPDKASGGPPETASFSPASHVRSTPEGARKVSDGSPSQAAGWMAVCEGFAAAL